MKHRGRLYLVVLLAVGLFALWGCPQKTEVSSAPETQKETVTAPAPPAGETSGKTEAKAEESKQETAAASEEGLKPIYFDFDRSIIRSDARSVMQANAKWLKANPKAKIRIEGNCDERGTIEYNQARGQRRSTSAKKYLTDMGISAKRITLISYGKEKPICSEQDEACWQKNRRDDFVVVSE